MSVAERIMLGAEIWDRIPSQAEIELTDTQQAELDRRTALLENTPIGA
jgi:putative addiction module component (TIGR02574 family)